MLCPRCECALGPSAYHDIVLDPCPECHGVWFDADELDPFLKHQLSERGDIPDARIKRPGTPESADKLREATRPCPRCHCEMDKFNYAYDSDIFLDRCSDCRGLWVDGDEIQQLLEFSKGNPKLDRMANSMAKHMATQERFKENAEAIIGFGRRAPWYAYCMPPVIIPLKDDLPTRGIPFFTWGIVLLNVAIFMYQSYWVENLSSFFLRYGFVPSEIAVHSSTLVTSMFLHINIFHLAGNMMFLWIFGDNIEKDFGRLSFVGFYVVSGVVASLSHYAMNADSSVPCVGASGAVAGVLGAYFVLHPRASVKTWIFYDVFDLPAVLFLGGWILVQVGYAMMFHALEVPGGTAWFAHIGGFVCGALLAWLYSKVRGTSVPNS